MWLLLESGGPSPPRRMWKWSFASNVCLIRGRARSDRRLCCVCLYVHCCEQRLPGVTVKRVLLCFLAVGRYQQASTLVEYSAFGSNQAARGPVGLFSIVWVGEQEAQGVWWGEQGEF